MFIGHFGLGLASRKPGALPSLAMLFIAVQFLDLLWPVFVLLGYEQFTIEPGNTQMTPLNFVSYPYSHSLLMATVWGMLLALIYGILTKNKRAAVLLGVLVVSHWVLDYLTHKPDLQLTPFDETRYGLGLWNHPVTEMVLELGLFLLGALLYYRRMLPQRKWSYGMLMLFFLLIHLANVYGPTPPSVSAVAGSALLMWIFIGWAWWIERK